MQTSVGRERSERRTASTRWRGRRASDYLVWAAILCGLIDFLLTAVLPVYTVDSGRAGAQPRYSLLHVFGPGVLVLGAIPLFVSVAVGVLLRLDRRDHRANSPVIGAWIASALLLVAAGIGAVTFLIGIYVLPCAIFLLAATSIRQDELAPKDSV